MRLKKKISRQSKIFKKAINAKWAFYWAKFMTEAAAICRKYEHKICGCILSGPDDWDEPKVIGHIVRTIIHEMAGGKK